MSIVQSMMAVGKKVANLHKMLVPTAGTVLLQADQAWEGNAVLEPTILEYNGLIYIFYTGSSEDTHHQIGVATTTSMSIPPTKKIGPIIGQGVGGAPSGRNANCSCACVVNGVFYVAATAGYGYAGDDKCVYLYSSTDPLTVPFTQVMKWFDLTDFAGIQRFGNTSIPQYRSTVQTWFGKIVILIEAFTGSAWEIFRAETTAMTVKPTITEKLPALRINPATMYGGPCHKFVNGKWHVWYHYGLGGSPRDSVNLPTVLAYATSLDTYTWNVKDSLYLGIEATPYTNTDQNADAYLEELSTDNCVYHLAEYVDNTSPVQAQIRVWKYNNTIKEMLARL